ncbi:hypothetical protein predicted by Glimmer/Critica [Acetobacter senegalensis]|uniref:Uncharacterized protein n=1 Tax=Acetobacter senegalensis TaxID=446692 RepID=A0A0U5ER61_9PROT|nr:hypothetical protein predicted by Glimmer/Critica [Acetobacter senegalensis]
MEPVSTVNPGYEAFGFSGLLRFSFLQSCFL